LFPNELPHLLQCQRQIIFLQKIDFPATRRYVESIIDRYKFYQRRERM
jgi:hypothetical protein